MTIPLTLLLLLLIADPWVGDKHIYTCYDHCKMMLWVYCNLKFYSVLNETVKCTKMMYDDEYNEGYV